MSPVNSLTPTASMAGARIPAYTAMAATAVTSPPMTPRKTKARKIGTNNNVAATSIPSTRRAYITTTTTASTASPVATRSRRAFV
jgi:hypothetical protein